MNFERKAGAGTGTPESIGLMRELVAAVAEEPGTTVAWFAARSASAQLRIRAVAGARSRRLDTLRVGRGQGVTGRVFQRGAVHWVDDYRASNSITHEFDGIIAAERIARMAAAPVMLGDEQIGVVSTASRSPGSYADRALTRTAELAGRISLVLANAGCGDAPAAEEPWQELAARAGSVSRLRRAADQAAGSARPGLSAELGGLSQLLHEAERRLAAILASAAAPAGARAAPTTALTPRQTEVLRLVAAGLTTRAIAERLSLSPETVKDYAAQAMQRLGARTRAEAIATAQDLGTL